MFSASGCIGWEAEAGCGEGSLEGSGQWVGGLGPKISLCRSCIDAACWQNPGSLLSAFFLEETRGDSWRLACPQDVPYSAFLQLRILLQHTEHSCNAKLFSSSTLLAPTLAPERRSTDWQGLGIKE